VNVGGAGVGSSICQNLFIKPSKETVKETYKEDKWLHTECGIDPINTHPKMELKATGSESLIFALHPSRIDGNRSAPKSISMGDDT
jgi:hypothetical protein